MKLDQPGIDFIKMLEGFKPRPYKDQAGVWTVGYGHIDGVTSTTPAISEKQAEILLLEDLEPIEESVSRATEVQPLTLNQFTALCSFAYNEGEQRFLLSALLDKLCLGDIPGAGKEFDKWIYYHDPATKVACISKGLQERRAKEKALFLVDFEASRLN